VGAIAHYLKYPYAEIGTPVAVIAAVILYYIGKAWIYARNDNRQERYRKRSAWATILLVLATAAIVILWARTLHNTGTFLGLVGGGVAIALKEPLLAIAGRISILASRVYSVGDRIQVEKLTGDVIDVGFFYTRMMELGNWTGGDQATGRIVQFSNSRIFGDTAVFNYTRNFSYIWDEIKLPVTYASNLKAAKEILIEAGTEYSKEFLQGAQRELEEMQRYFVVSDMQIKPQVYLKVTDNWVELTLRYLVEPRHRRMASNFIYERAFERLQGHRDITIASTTSDVAIHWKEDESSSGEKARQEAPGAPDKAA
jgi:small-conductance mechanosensitive channel